MTVMFTISPTTPTENRGCLRVALCLFCLLLLAPQNIDSEETITIAAVFSLSGKATSSNKPAVDGVRISVKEINDSGGLLGKKLELLLLDNKSTPIGSHLAAQKAIEAGAVGIIGAAWSSHSLAIAKVVAQTDIPMISPVSTIPSLTDIGDNIFRVCYNDDLQGSLIAEYAFENLGAKTSLLFTDISSDFSLYISKVFKKTFSALGGQILHEIEYKTGQGEYSDQIDKASQYHADILFLSGHDESGFLAYKLKSSGVHGIPIGSDGWDSNTFYTSGGKHLQKAYFINHWISTHEDASSQLFVQRYGKKYSLAAPTALSYDAVHILAAAIQQADLEKDKTLLKSLQNIKGFKGVTGEISFNSRGDAVKQACIIEIRNGSPYFLNCYKQQ